MAFWESHFVTFCWKYSKAKESMNYKYIQVGSHLCYIEIELHENALSKVLLGFTYRATDANS